MSVSFIAKIIFVLALAFAMSTPLAGTAAACDPNITGLC